MVIPSEHTKKGIVCLKLYHRVCIVLLGTAHAATLSSWNCTLVYTGGSKLWRQPHPHISAGHYPNEDLVMVMLLQQPSAWVICPWLEVTSSFKIWVETATLLVLIGHNNGCTMAHQDDQERDTGMRIRAHSVRWPGGNGSSFEILLSYRLLHCPPAMEISKTLLGSLFHCLDE